LIGNRPARIFMQGMEAYELNPGDDLNFLLK
jgi:dipeptidase E